MAQRRMFSKTIISSARFLKMPTDSQNLYFHLGLNADDDGIVEAYSVMRIIGSNEDNLRVLVSKGFVKVLNEDLVSYITDWKEHNLIRADRKIDSIYKNLLLKLVPDVEILKAKERADVKKISGRNLDVQLTTNGQHRLGKDRLGKDRKENIEILYSDGTVLKKSPETELKKPENLTVLCSDGTEIVTEKTYTIPEEIVVKQKKKRADINPELKDFKERMRHNMNVACAKYKFEEIYWDAKQIKQFGNIINKVLSLRDGDFELARILFLDIIKKFAELKKGKSGWWTLSPFTPAILYSRFDNIREEMKIGT